MSIRREAKRSWPGARVSNGSKSGKSPLTEPDGEIGEASAVPGARLGTPTSTADRFRFASQSLSRMTSSSDWKERDRLRSISTLEGEMPPSGIPRDLYRLLGMSNSDEGDSGLAMALNPGDSGTSLKGEKIGTLGPIWRGWCKVGGGKSGLNNENVLEALPVTVLFDALFCTGIESGNAEGIDARRTRSSGGAMLSGESGVVCATGEGGNASVIANREHVRFSWSVESMDGAEHSATSLHRKLL